MINQVNCWMCGARCHSNPDRYQKALCRPCYVKTKPTTKVPMVRTATCQVCGVQWDHGGPGLSPSYCVQHTNNRAARRRLGVWVPRYGIGTCVWCGDWFGRMQERQTACTVSCAKKITRRVPSRYRQEHKNCAVCGIEFSTSDSRRKFCGSKTCKSRGRQWQPEGMTSQYAARSRYAQLRRAAVSVGDRDLTTLTIYKKAGGVCAACGIDTLHPQTPRGERARQRFNWATLDHIVPLSQGGSHAWDNAQLLCLSCNSRKSHTDRRALISVPA